MKEQVCRRCGDVGEWNICRTKTSMYYKFPLCGLCSIIVSSVAKSRPKSDLAKKKMRASRKSRP